MKKCMLCVCCWALFFISGGYAQPKTSVKTSQVVVIYDKNVYQPITGSVIPFDARFTLQVPHYATPAVKHVQAYRANFDQGARLVEKDASGQARADMDLPFKVVGDTLNIFFPAIEPSTNFEVAVASQLNGSLLQAAFDLNEDLYMNDNAKAVVDFASLRDGAMDNALKISYFQYNRLPRYQLFYTAQLSTFYTQLHRHSTFRLEDFPDLADLNMLENRFAAALLVFKDNNRLAQIYTDASRREILEGVRTVRYDNSSKPTSQGNFTTRLANLQASAIFFDTLTNTINSALAIRDETVLRNLLAKVKLISKAIAVNKKTIQDIGANITDAITNNEDILSVDILVGSTIARDIKTAGGNHITMDLGLSNILTLDTRNVVRYMPKPYYGINIYLRAIDKNSREKDFLKKKPKNTDPSYSMASVNDWKQHLSFSIGLTFTGMTNSQFDNLFNSATLMFGPGYRIRRCLKIGMGMALLKRSSKDPLVSDKKVIGGYYLSFSADIDVVQGIKDFISIIFK